MDGCQTVHACPHLVRRGRTRRAVPFRLLTPSTLDSPAPKSRNGRGPRFPAIETWSHASLFSRGLVDKATGRGQVVRHDEGLDMPNGRNTKNDRLVRPIEFPALFAVFRSSQNLKKLG